jgi:hypothetical protein
MVAQTLFFWGGPSLTIQECREVTASCGKAPQGGAGGNEEDHPSKVSPNENHFPMHQKYPKKKTER